MVSLEELVNRRRNSVWEDRVAQELRQLREQDAFVLLHKMIDARPMLGLILATRVLRSKKYFIQILEGGMVKGNASTISWWLKACGPRLGWRTILKELKKRIIDNPAAVRRALYFVPRFIDKKDEFQVSLLAYLKQSVGEPRPVKRDGLYCPTE